MIGGRSYSHIIDPATGRPADAVPSVTVLARDAVTADIWATALSVLGPEGFDRLPKGVDALIVVGTPTHHEMLSTPGFRDRLERPLPERLVMVTQGAGEPDSSRRPERRWASELGLPRRRRRSR